MNKRIRKKQLPKVLMDLFLHQEAVINNLDELVHAQHEQIEILGNELAELKTLVMQNTKATNNELESLDGKIKKVADDLKIKMTKKGFWKNDIQGIKTGASEW